MENKMPCNYLWDAERKHYYSIPERDFKDFANHNKVMSLNPDNVNYTFSLKHKPWPYEDD